MVHDIDRPLWGIFGSTNAVSVWAFILPLESKEGFTDDNIAEATGLSLKRIAPIIEMLLSRGCIRRVPGCEVETFQLNYDSHVVRAMRMFLTSGYWDYIRRKSLVFATVIKHE